jgi:hypothetical protein
MTRTTSTFAALALLVASIVGGAFVSGALDDGEERRELPPREDTIPILAPSETVPIAPDASPTEAAAAAVGGAGGAGVALSEPITELSPAATDTLRETADDASSAARRYGSLDLSTFLLRFFDAACDEERGERSEPDGTCSTVLSLIDPPPFEILEVVVGPEAAAREECGATFDLGPEERSSYPVLIISNNPADFTVTSGPAGGTLGEPQSRSTAEDQVRLWESWLEADLTPGVDGREVHTCFVVFADPPVTTPWTLHVEGTFGTADPPESDSADASFDAVGITPDPRPRPPVSASPVDDNHVLVRIPAFGPPRIARSQIRFGLVNHIPGFPGLETPSAVCETTDPADLRAVEVPERIETIPGTDDASYPYDPAYTLFGRFRSDALFSGRTYALCVVWVDDGAVLDRASLLIVAASRYHWTAGLVGLDFDEGPQPPNVVTLEVDSYDRILGVGGAGPLCTQTPTSSTPVDSVIFMTAAEVDGECASQRNAASSEIRWRHLHVLRLLVRHGGEVSEAWVTYRREPCTDVAREECRAYLDLYRVPVPGIDGATAIAYVSFVNYTAGGSPTWEIGSEA